MGPSMIGKPNRSIEKPKAPVRMEILGEELCMKTVKRTGQSGRIYLPSSWIGRRVKVVRVD
jgi:putative transposon-encoded protein